MFFLWAVKSGQYDDVEAPKYRVLDGYLEWIRGVRKQLRIEGRITLLKDRIAEQSRQEAEKDA